MTSPRAERDWLMALASSRRSPVAPVLSDRSDPAKSTRLSFPVVVFPVVLSLTSTRMDRIEWLRLDSAFIFVAPVCRMLLPVSNSFTSEAAVGASRMVTFFTKTIFFASTLTSSFGGPSPWRLPFPLWSRA